MAIPQPQAPNCLDYCYIPHTTPSNHHLFILFVCLEGDADKDLMRGAPLSQTQFNPSFLKGGRENVTCIETSPRSWKSPEDSWGRDCKTQFLLDLPLSKLCKLSLQCDPSAPAQCPRGPENSLPSNCSQTPQVQAHQPGDPLHGCILGDRLFG